MKKRVYAYLHTHWDLEWYRDKEDFMENYSWKTINNLFKKWLANTAIEQFGSRKEAAKALRCEEKTLYNAKIGE